MGIKFATVSQLKRSKLKLAIVAGALLVFLLTSITTGTLIWYNLNIKPLDPATEQQQIVTIPAGASIDQIGRLLFNEEIIRSPTALKMYISRKGIRNQLQAGTYQLGPQMSVPEIVDKLTSGDIAMRTITFVPGRRLEQLRLVMIEAGWKEKKVDNALKTAGRQKLTGILPRGANLEGYLFADTYLVGLNQPPEAVINLAIDQLLKHLTNDVRHGIEAQGLTIHEGVILASIIEREAGREVQERRQISQVFLKRLKEGMRLDADATTRYGINKATGPLTVADLNSSSPYNTRRVSGLTPGPIGNFSLSSLEAVAFPSEGDYLYFVAGQDKVTRFSRTLEEHEALKRQYGVRGEQ